MRRDSGPSRWGVIAAFASIYLIWGSTFLAIRWGIETIPPFLMAGLRFLSAGAILYPLVRLTGTPAPHRSHWKDAALIGTLLLLCGNGGVTWSEQHVPSGIASMLIATIPLWIVLLGWLWKGSARPTPAAWAGLLLGFAGIALLIDPAALAGGPRIDPTASLVLVLSAGSWAVGSLHSRTANLPGSPLLATSMQLLCGGAVLLIVSAATGEWSRVDLAAVSARSAMSLAYLSVFGSVVAFSAYVWLLRVSTPARVATYAYVNPVVALLLGWIGAGEPIGPRTLLASTTILASVILTTTRPVAAAHAPERALAGETA